MVVNIRGVVYLVDAYNAPGVVTQDVEGHLSYAKKLEIVQRRPLTREQLRALARSLAGKAKMADITVYASDQTREGVRTLQLRRYQAER